MWIATEIGLDRIDPTHLGREDPPFEHYRHDAANPRSLTPGRVLTSLEDRYDRLWIGTRDGLSILDPGSEASRRYIHDPERPDSLTYSSILALHEDPSGILWIGFDGGGLDRFDPRSESFMPICTSCKKIRDDDGGWHQMEACIDAHSEASFTHGLCPSCVIRLYPDVDLGKLGES